MCNFVTKPHFFLNFRTQGNSMLSATPTDPCKASININFTPKKAIHKTLLASHFPVLFVLFYLLLQP